MKSTSDITTQRIILGFWWKTPVTSQIRRSSYDSDEKHRWHHNVRTSGMAGNASTWGGNSCFLFSQTPWFSHSWCVFHIFQKILFKSKHCDSGSIILQIQVLLCNQFILHHPESFDVFLAYILRAPDIRQYWNFEDGRPVPEQNIVNRFW